MQKETSSWNKPDHIGIVVRDLDKAVAYYESIGIGPFIPRKMTTPEEMSVYGKPTPKFMVKIAFASVGPINIELVQPVEQAVLQDEFLKTKGEGINHVGFVTDNLKRENEKLNKKGIEIVLSSNRANGSAASYYDTRKVGGVLLEFIQRG